MKSLSKLISREVILPACTFVIGVLTTILLTDYINKHNPVLVTLCGVLLLLILIIGLSLSVLKNSETSLATIDKRISKLVERSGLSVEYVEDRDTGESYRRATTLIQAARESLTFVDTWEPFEDYHVGPEARTGARRDFYSAIIAQVEHHQNDHEMFHRRIVQVPPQYASGSVPFSLDPYFYNYLLNVAQMQSSRYEACTVRITPVHVINAHFIMIDRRYIILPLLTADAESNRQIRHGALFFDDREGDLFRSLRGIYRAIDAHARPLTERDLMPGQARPVAERGGQ